MINREPDIIVSRFNRHKAVQGKYLVERGAFGVNGEHLIEIRKDSDNYTIVTSKVIEGRWRGEGKLEIHCTGELSWEVIDQNEEDIIKKERLSEAVGVRINKRSCFWLSSDAVLPFCNLLNFLN